MVTRIYSFHVVIFGELQVGYNATDEWINGNNDQ